MRYDGMAIRSKTYNKSFVDKIWNFFSSVKVGISLIIITLIAASVGTLLPQEFYVKASDMEKGLTTQTYMVHSVKSIIRWGFRIYIAHGGSRFWLVC